MDKTRGGGGGGVEGGDGKGAGGKLGLRVGAPGIQHGI